MNELATRTERTIVWILGEAITDAATAVANDPAALLDYAAAPAPGTFSRTTIAPSAAMQELVDTLHSITDLPPSVITRAAWSRWLTLYSVDDIVAFCGGVRPALERVPA
ncbi:hypothetical protein [Gordonia sihwensis]|uniref:hypothetical protein n=1 Tax=Gordonia sihwensis TaxID=173559 RepID=UPI0012DFFB24|nr:hypothetical protein [Gordonia sihwensis]